MKWTVCAGMCVCKNNCNNNSNRLMGFRDCRLWIRPCILFHLRAKHHIPIVYLNFHSHINCRNVFHVNGSGVCAYHWKPSQLKMWYYQFTYYDGNEMIYSIPFFSRSSLSMHFCFGYCLFNKPQTRYELDRKKIIKQWSERMAVSLCNSIYYWQSAGRIKP